MKPPVYNPSWGDDVRAVFQHDMQEIWDPGISRHIWNQYHNQLDIYSRLAEGKGRLEILDVGCAQGTLALMLAERGHSVWAVDIRQQFLDYARTRYEYGNVSFVCGNVMDLELGKQFDLIFANQIVEHLVYPLEFTERLVKCLKSGGQLIMTTPNGGYLKNSLPSYSELGPPEQYADRQFTADADGHFFAYRSKELVDIFEAAGLRDVESRCFETPFISGHMKVRHVHSIIPPKVLSLLDSLTLLTPKVGVRLAHQLMVMGTLSR
jgi:2-polyprenyl-3-methyl-5-hydroxy-6-metoxy-1,4-benzoquinol methylase